MDAIDLQRRLADALVALGWAHRKPLAETRCTITIELASVNRGNYYVTHEGSVLHGYTAGEAQPIGPQSWHKVIDVAGLCHLCEGAATVRGKRCRLCHGAGIEPRIEAMEDVLRELGAAYAAPPPKVVPWGPE